MEEVDDWEFLAGDGSLDGGRREIIPREVEIDHDEGLLDASYFICSTSPSHLHPIHLTTTSETAQDPISIDENRHHDTEPVAEVKEIPVLDVSVVKEVIGEKVVVAAKDSKFVDMKVEDIPNVRKEDLPEEPFKSKVENHLTGCESVPVKDEALIAGLMEEEKSSDDGRGFGIWGWRVTRLGALCSLGVAAATICIIVLGRQSQMQHRQQQSQKFRFNSCADDSRIKQAARQASRLNQAMSAIRGVPFTGAQITFGGYYNGL
ncbi:unnamed protein product [Victoria cruziana]